MQITGLSHSLSRYVQYFLIYLAVSVVTSDKKHAKEDHSVTIWPNIEENNAIWDAPQDELGCLDGQDCDEEKDKMGAYESDWKIAKLSSGVADSLDHSQKSKLGNLLEDCIEKKYFACHQNMNIDMEISRAYRHARDLETAYADYALSTVREEHETVSQYLEGFYSVLDDVKIATAELDNCLRCPQLAIPPDDQPNQSSSAPETQAYEEIVLNKQDCIVCVLQKTYGIANMFQALLDIVMLDVSLGGEKFGNTKSEVEEKVDGLTKSLELLCLATDSSLLSYKSAPDNSFSEKILANSYEKVHEEDAYIRDNMIIREIVKSLSYLNEL